MKLFSNEYKEVFILLVIIFFLFWMFIYKSYQHLETKKYYDNYIESINDTILIWKDKFNQEHTKTTIIESNNKEQFLQINSKDSIIQELQILLKQYKSKGIRAATISKTETIIDTILISKKDSLLISTDVNLDGWIYGNVTYCNDSTHLNLKVRNEYDIIQGVEKSFFNEKPYIEIINKNPYTTTKVLRSYQIKQFDKKFALGIQLGYGISTHFKPVPYIGIGLQYNLLSF